MYDLIIVGGGPAGATLSRLLGKQYRILLLEKRDFQVTDKLKKEKCCGGLIAPDAQLMFARFGLGIPKEVLLSPQLFAVRTIDLDNSLERYYQRHYLNIDREAFDQWLESLIPDNVTLINNACYRSFELQGEQVKVNFTVAGKAYQETARMLVGADGAFSQVRKQGFGKLPSPKLYVAVQEWYETDHNLNYYGAIFDREITDFYAWTIPKENYLILGAALKPRERVLEKFELLKQKLSRCGFEFGKIVKRNGTHLLRPTQNQQICAGDQRVALLGEAAGLISPSSAEGLSYAFKSALALAQSLESGLDGYQARYQNDLKSLRTNIFLKNFKSPAMYQQQLRSLILNTGVMSVAVEE